MERLETSAGYRPARNGRPLAPAGVQVLLALEESRRPTWKATARPGDPDSPAPDERRESALGRTENPRRTSQARHRDLANDCGEVHAPAQATPIPDVASLPRQPPGGSRGDRLLHRSFSDIQDSLRLRRVAPRPCRWLLRGGAVRCRAHRAPCGPWGARRSHENGSPYQRSRPL